MEENVHPTHFGQRARATGRLRIAGATLAAAALLVSLAGCPPPLPPDAVFVRIAPPPPPVEVVEVAPGPGFLWIHGHYRWSGSAYVWVAGRWEARPHRRAVWVEGRWVHHRRGWYWREGHWR